MINLSSLLGRQQFPGDSLRFQPHPPVVVWNLTRDCNLNCLHCYAPQNAAEKQPAELTTTQAKQVISQLANFGIPVLLFSGGEPLMRPDLFELISFASSAGIRPALSTNATLIDEKVAQQLHQAGIVYVGASLDGLEKTNDRFRCQAGAFARALEGMKHCRQAGIKVGIRFTLTNFNYQEIPGIFSLLKELHIPRLCFYHLVPAGRGREHLDLFLTHQQTRESIAQIIQLASQELSDNPELEVLTVDNHSDGVFLYLKLKQKDPSRAAQVCELLERQGGALSSSGVGIAALDPAGNIHPDQFWTSYSLGNVLEQDFATIWQRQDDPLLQGLRHRRQHIKGRCRLCRYFDLCGGGLRVRALYFYDDPWAPEPACYLSDDEIGLDQKKQTQLHQGGEHFPFPSSFL